MNLFNKIFKQTFLFIVLAELLSLCGYLLPDFNKIAFLIIVALTLILSLYKLEYGVWILLAELFIGSKGYLFFFDNIMSIRIALWLIVMAVWAGKVISNWIRTKKLNIEFFKSSYRNYFFILFLFIIWGIINGILQNNEFGNVFFDFNGWLYFLLVFPIYHVINKKFVNNILQIFTASVVWLSVKTFFLLFIFSHNMTGMIYEIYRWVRTSGVGEITQIEGGFYRIFFQSHVFALIGLFIFLLLLFDRIKNHKFKAPNSKQIQSAKFQSSKLIPQYKDNLILFSVFCFLFSTIIISFSRSFWVGLIFGLFFCFFVFLFYYKIGWKKILRFSGILFACAAISFLLIAAIVKFPYPSPTGGFSTFGLLSERASDISEGAAVSSRWNLLPELWKEIKKASILGQGFGSTITYISSDPRVLESSPTGEYTTYAFEWGWLDIWLKLGLFGLLAYLILIGKIFIDAIKQKENTVIISLALGLLIISVVSFFSPYLNHPLGIGYLIIVSAIINFQIKKGTYNK